MPRQSRIVVPHFPHHLILRGNNRRRLFSYSSDYRRFLYELRCAARRFPCLVHSVVLMTNHVHLVVTPEEQPALSSFVKQFAQRYSVFRNRSREASGKLFEQRFKSFVITKTAQLAVVMAYVELNPVRAAIVREPGDYRWSTYRTHAGVADADPLFGAMWTPSQWYATLGSCEAERAANYRQWVADCAARNMTPEAGKMCPPAEAPTAASYTLRLERPDRRRAI